MLVKMGQCSLETRQGDIANQPNMVAIVNAANAELRMGGGVAGAIHKAAGPELEKECQSLAPITPGEAVITGAYRLPNQYIIHCLGPIYGLDKPEDTLLSSCYRNALNLADRKQIHSIAFPAISTGAFGYPIKLATQVALNTVNQVLPTLRHVKCIRFVLFSEAELDIYNSKLTAIFDSKDTND